MVIGWYFSVKNEWIPLWILLAPSIRVAVCFDGCIFFYDIQRGVVLI